MSKSSFENFLESIDGTTGIRVDSIPGISIRYILPPSLWGIYAQKNLPPRIQSHTRLISGIEHIISFERNLIFRVAFPTGVDFCHCRVIHLNKREDIIGEMNIQRQPIENSPTTKRAIYLYNCPGISVPEDLPAFQEIIAKETAKILESTGKIVRLRHRQKP